MLFSHKQVKLFLELGILLDLEQNVLTKPVLLVLDARSNIISLVEGLKALSRVCAFPKPVKLISLFAFAARFLFFACLGPLVSSPNSFNHLILFSSPFLLLIAVVSLIVDTVDTIEEGKEAIDRFLPLLRNIAVVIMIMSANLGIATIFLFRLFFGSLLYFSLLVVRFFDALLSGPAQRRF